MPYLKAEYRKELHCLGRLQPCLAVLSHYSSARSSAGLGAVFCNNSCADWLWLKHAWCPQKAEAGHWGTSSIRTRSRAQVPTASLAVPHVQMLLFPCSTYAAFNELITLIGIIAAVTKLITPCDISPHQSVWSSFEVRSTCMPAQRRWNAQYTCKCPSSDKPNSSETVPFERTVLLKMWMLYSTNQILFMVVRSWHLKQKHKRWVKHWLTFGEHVRWI